MARTSVSSCSQASTNRGCRKRISPSHLLLRSAEFVAATVMRVGKLRSISLEPRRARFTKPKVWVLDCEESWCGHSSEVLWKESALGYAHTNAEISSRR